MKKIIRCFPRSLSSEFERYFCNVISRIFYYFRGKIRGKKENTARDSENISFRKICLCRGKIIEMSRSESRLKINRVTVSAR